MESIKITSEEHKPKFKKTAWTQNPESPIVSFEENDPMNNDNDQNYSALSIDTDM